MSIKVVKQYTVFLPDEPGKLSSFLSIFSDSDVNILGIASEIKDNSGIVRVATDSEVNCSTLFTNAGFSVLENTLISVELFDKPKSLQMLADVLAKANINIGTVYGTGVGGQKTRVLITVSDINKAVEVLKSSPAIVDPR